MRLNLIFILFFLMTLSLTACNEEVQTKKNLLPQLSQSSQAIGKPHAAISMNYKYLNAVKLNQVVEIKLSFKVGLNTEALKIDVRSYSGLKFNDSQLEYQFNNVAKGDINSFVIRVTAPQSGKHIINITSSINMSGVAQARSFIVPFNVGSSAALKTNKNNVPKGMKYLPEQNIISMPASETTNK